MTSLPKQMTSPLVIAMPKAQHGKRATANQYDPPRGYVMAVVKKAKESVLMSVRFLRGVVSVIIMIILM